jgi:hypothetical protein
MRRSLLLIITLLFVSAFLFSGCLWVEKSQYTFNINPDGSGSGTVRFVNICYTLGEDSTTSEAAYGELNEGYLTGMTYENNNPHLTFTGKRFFADGDNLCAEMSFTFTSIDSIGFFRYKQCDNASFLYVAGQSLEVSPADILDFNAAYSGKAGEVPVLVWPGDTKLIKFTTEAKADSGNAKKHVSLLGEWQKNHK